MSSVSTYSMRAAAPDPGASNLAGPFDGVSRTLAVRAAAPLGLVVEYAASLGVSVGEYPAELLPVPVGTLLQFAAESGLSPAYGSLGDRVVALEATLINGARVGTIEVPRSSTGPDFKRFFVGAGEVCGVIEAVVLRVHQKHLTRATRGFTAPGWDAAHAFARQLRMLELYPEALAFSQHGPGAPVLADVRLNAPAGVFQAQVAALEGAAAAADLALATGPTGHPPPGAGYAFTAPSPDAEPWLETGGASAPVTVYHGPAERRLVVAGAPVRPPAGACRVFWPGPGAEPFIAEPGAAFMRAVAAKLGPS